MVPLMESVEGGGIGGISTRIEVKKVGAKELVLSLK